MPKKGMTSLFLAVAYNDATIVKCLIDSGIPVNTKDPKWGRTPLFAAVLNNNLQIAELLLQNAADPNERANDDSAPLHVAVTKRSKEMVELLLRHHTDVNPKIKHSGKTPLYLAIEADSSEIVELLLRCGANISHSTIQGRTLLHVVLKKKNKALALLVARICCKCEVNVVDYGLTPLHLAIEKGYYEVVDLLIKKGANVNEMTYRYVDPLHMAVMQRDRKMAELLIRNGARMNMTAYGLSLHYAISRRYKEIVELLLETGTGKINDYNRDGLTALHVAVLCGQLDMAELCIGYGANLNALCTNNLPILYYATERGDRRMTKLLLNKGARANEYVCECTTLLDNAMLWRYETIVRLLLEHGAVINVYRDDDEVGMCMVIKCLAQLTSRNSKSTTKVAQQNLETVRNCDRWRTYYEACQLELVLMKSEQLFGSVSYHDLLTPDANKLAAYARNEELERGFPRGGYRQKFTIYSSVLSLKYAQARVRSVLMHEAELGFVRLDKCGLPSVCAQKVLGYLANDDLKNFVQGVCECRVSHNCLPEMLITF